MDRSRMAEAGVWVQGEWGQRLNRSSQRVGEDTVHRLMVGSDRAPWSSRFRVRTHAMVTKPLLESIMRLPPLIASAALLCVALFAPAQAAERATWIWESPSYAMVEDEAYARDAIAFLRARRINTVYLYADAFLGENLLVQKPALYRNLISRMHGEGLQVHALLGASDLTVNALVRQQPRQAIKTALQQVLAYQRLATATDGFDGVQIYNEPRLLADLTTRREDLIGQFLDLSKELMALKQQSGLQISLGAAIPFWFDDLTLAWQGRSRPVSEHLIDLYDSTAVTAYREHADGPDGIIERARNELNYAALHGKRVVIGVEIAPNRMADATFDDNTEAELEGELQVIERANRTHPAFSGFALHHMDAYLMWLVRQWMDAPTGDGTATPAMSAGEPALPPVAPSASTLSRSPTSISAAPGLQ